jgi:hypothetical protein
MGASQFGAGLRSALLQNVTTVGVVPVVCYLSAISFDVATLQLIVESGTLTGNWTLDGSNDYAEANWEGQPATAGHWTPIVPAASPAMWQPALAAVVAPYPAATGNQAINGFGFGWRTVRITFTPTANTGVISVFAVAKASN